MGCGALNASYARDDRLPAGNRATATWVNAMFSLKGGARLNWTNITIPFAVLSGDSNALRLSCFRRDYVFDRSCILGLSRFCGMFSIGLRIEHTVPTYPGFVVFWVSMWPWSRRFAALKEDLERHGYQVQS
jgi:hypothetical protein